MDKRLVATAGAVAVVAAPVVRRLTGRKDVFGNARNDPRRWHVVTVLCSPQDVSARQDTPLDGLDDSFEVQVRPAPGDRGTELAARLTASGDGDGADRVRALRAALRETKQLLEVGYVLHPSRPGTTRPTPLNAPLRAATEHGRGEGRL
jgi:hypothetical protein